MAQLAIPRTDFDEAIRRSLDLTPLQKRTLVIAYMNGYYEFPRGIRLSELAGRMEVTPSSMSETLRAAERKVMRRFSLAIGDQLGSGQSEATRGVTIGNNVDT